MTLLTETLGTRAVFLRVTLPLSGVNFLNQAARALLATIGPLLALEFDLSARELGLLAAMFFTSYAAAQLPVGVAMDMYGVRRVQISLALLAGAGFLLCAVATGPFTLALGRMVTGFGISVGMIAMLTAHTQWVAREKVAAMTGSGTFMASAGAILATWPAQQALPLLGWRGLFWLLAGVSVLVSAAIWWRMPERPPSAPRHRTVRHEMAEYGRIFRHPVFFRSTFAVALLTCLSFVYGGLWAGPWLRDVGGFEDGPRAMLLGVFMAGMMAGSLSNGHLASALHRRGFNPMTMAYCGLGLIWLSQWLLIWVPSRDPLVIGAIWFAFAFASSAGPSGYAAVSHRFPTEIAGRVATSMNFTMLVLVFIFQNAIGWILDFWPRTETGGWASAGYGWALGLTVAFQTVAMLGLLPSRTKSPPTPAAPQAP